MVTRAWAADVRAGFKGVLMKPFTREKLRDTLLAHRGPTRRLARAERSGGETSLADRVSDLVVTTGSLARPRFVGSSGAVEAV